MTLLSRLQFALTAMFHILYPVLTIVVWQLRHPLFF